MPIPAVFMPRTASTRSPCIGNSAARAAPVQAREPKSESRTIRNAERKAFNTLGLEISVSRAEIKAKFHDLVKRHHPDSNGGDRSTEDRLIEIIQAYNYLKSVGFC